MALYLDEGVVEENVSSQRISTLQKWLTDNRLGRLSRYFEELVFEDLWKYNDQTIRFVIILYSKRQIQKYAFGPPPLFSEMWQDKAVQKLGLGVFYKKRFKRAIRTLQSHSNHEEQHRAPSALHKILDTLDVQQWIECNRLKNLGPYFEREEVTLQDIKLCNEETIEF